jgi:signal transduction histidine kinase
MVRFEVVDRGTGIAPELFERLFRKFSQGNSSDIREQGGTGLGLAISRAIVEQHGGAIGAESEPNRRTTFWFTVPMVSSEVPTDADDAD